MCGIVGLVPNWKTTGFTAMQNKMVQQLLYAGCLRGWDATGVILPFKDGSYTVAKEASDGGYFGLGKDFDSLLKETWKHGVGFIGHNRAKTVGANKDENAHPFVVDNTFAMVHNGTLTNHLQLGQTEVDSEALAQVLAKGVYQEDWKAGLEEQLGRVRGAYACVWYDQKTETISMVRNSQRPLAIVKTDKEVLFGSEAGMLIWIATRNGSVIKEVIDTKIDTLYTISTKKPGGDISETFLTLKAPSVVTPVLPMKHTGKNSVTKEKKEEFKPMDTSMFLGNVKQLSKNAFKRMSRTLLGKELNFYPEDFIENDPLNPMESTAVLAIGYCLNGSYDLCKVRHSVKAIAKVAKGTSPAIFDRATYMSAKVTHCDYDAPNKAIIIHCNNARVLEWKHEVVH